MRKVTLFLASAFLVLFVAACGSDQDERAANEGREGTTVRNDNKNPSTRKEYARLEFPRLKGGDNNLVIVHSTSDYGVNYSLEWDVAKKSQRWSCYEMYESNSVTNTSRYYGDPQYPADPDLPSGYGWSPENDPYYGSGYDHGHIVASAERYCSAEANYQTFYLTNMQPMRNLFNSKLWAKMEQQVWKTWNRPSFRDTLYVCKGGTIDRNDQILGYTKKGAIIPKYFFIAVLCKNKQGYKAMGFWVEHINADLSGDSLKDYMMSIDELEERTGIDFFCNLPDDVERQVEDNMSPAVWGFK